LLTLPDGTRGHQVRRDRRATAEEDAQRRHGRGAAPVSSSWRRNGVAPPVTVHRFFSMQRIASWRRSPRACRTPKMNADRVVEEPLEEYLRGYATDPFGNRLETHGAHGLTAR
jgi:hypothetical protein